MTVVAEDTATGTAGGGPPARPPWGRIRWRRVAAGVALCSASIALAFALSALLIALTEGTPSKVFSAMYEGSLANGAAIGQTIDEAVPLLIVALGTIICTRAGIFNIGQEGQVAIGITTGAALGLFVHGPGPLMIVLVLLAAATGGALWAGLAAVMQFWRGVSVVISTLLLTFVAQEVVSFAVGRPWLLQETRRPGEIVSPQSDRIPDSVHLPRIGEFPHFNVGTGVLVALALAFGVYLFLDRTRYGFQIRMLGLNAVAARRAGVSAAVVGGGALLLSGASAGLAGGVMLTGSIFRVQAGASNNVGFEGLLVALVARRRPIVAIPVAFFFGALRSGGGFLAATGVPRYLVDVVQALLVLATVFPPAYQELRRRQRDLALARAAARGEATA